MRSTLSPFSSPFGRWSRGRCPPPLGPSVVVVSSSHTNHPFTLHAGRLTQQYIIEAWPIIEDAKLRWIRENQKALRRDVYLGVVDALAQDADIDPDNIGKRFILPSSHIGSRRFMCQCFQDSMAIVGADGNPTFFITVTCNPNWPEIQRHLFSGQSAADRPDLIACVFHPKLQSKRRISSAITPLDAGRLNQK